MADATTNDENEVTAPPIPSAASDVLRSGPFVSPLNRVQLYSDSEFEKLTQEWAFGCLKKEYALVRRASGAGDRGRDLCAYVKDEHGEWDNYQCKCYDHPLSPGDVWLELGKLTYFTFTNAFRVPRKYYFVAPRDLGPELARLLEAPLELRDGLIAVWEQHCEKKIIKRKEIPLSGALDAYVRAFDFSIVTHKPILAIVEGLRPTPYFAPRFGLGLIPARPDPALPPQTPTPAEARYVEQLYEAYADNLNKPLDQVKTQLASHERHKTHFDRARTSFYCAEALRQFGRDTFPTTNFFRQLQDEIHAGVVDVVDRTHPDGFERVLATTAESLRIQVSRSNLLGEDLKTTDRHGICHQLANDDRLTWVPKDASGA